MNESNFIGHVLKSLRKDKGYSRADAAYVLDISVQDLRGYEKGLLSVSPAMLAVIFEVYGVDVK